MLESFTSPKERGGEKIMLKKTFDKILQRLLPQFCILCNIKCIDNLALCTACRNELPWLKNGCPQCGNSLFFNTAEHIKCGNCIQQAHPFENTIALFHYQEPIIQLINQLKFNKKLIYAHLFGKLFTNHLKNYYNNKKFPDFIIPVPLHSYRLRERGYNQAIEIARPIAKSLKIPLLIHNCQKIKSTPAQSSLTAEERKKNIKNAFAIKSALTPPFLHVAIIDDVVTTGSTVTELSKILRLAGAKKIDIWCCARTRLH